VKQTMKYARDLFVPLLAASLQLTGCTASTSDESVEEAHLAAETLTGNGGPSGAHYNLNLIGVSNNKSADLTGNDGHRIFVPLTGSTKIMLSQGDFQVLDANGTDGQAAFQLPNPDPDNDGVTQYSVFARARSASQAAARRPPAARPTPRPASCTAASSRW
jgi:hypothetical protein